MSDEIFAKNLLHTRLVNASQIEAAKVEQAVLAKTGTKLILAEVLLRQSVITPAIRENVEKIAQAQKVGGIQQLGIYKLLKKLGEGAMGAVFLAEDTVAQRQVALKVLSKKSSSNDTFLIRFKREAKAAGALKHPNIVRAYTSRDTDVVEDLGHYFYAMEYVVGTTLEEVIKKQTFMPWDQSLDVCIQVARGLAFAHERGIIHRDIKPANVYMCEDGTAKILDMGLSKDISADAASQSFNTLEGQVLGTPHYISPEQAQGHKNIDGRADIYSLGASLYHMLTGKTPFEGATPANIIFKHVTDAVPNPQKIRSEIPDSIYRLLQKMMAKEPSERHADCAALLSEMAMIRAGSAPLTRSEQAAKDAKDAQKLQAEEDARFVRNFMKWARIGGMAVGAIVVLLILNSVVRSIFGPSRQVLDRRAELAALHDDSDDSLKRGNVERAMEKYDKILKLSAEGDMTDAVVLELVERAKKEKAKLAAQQAEAEKQKKESLEEAQRKEDAKKKLAAEQKQAEEEVHRQALAQLKNDEKKKVLEAQKLEEQKKADEEALAQLKLQEEKKKQQLAAEEVLRQKQEEARVAAELNKERMKKLAPLRTEIMPSAGSALAELAIIEKKLSDGANYAQFTEAFRDGISRVQTFLDLPQLKTLTETYKDDEFIELRKLIQSAADKVFECQAAWREKNNTGKNFDLQSWLGKIYGDLENGKALFEKLKKSE